MTKLKSNSKTLCTRSLWSIKDINLKYTLERKKRCHFQYLHLVLERVLAFGSFVAFCNLPKLFVASFAPCKNRFKWSKETRGRPLENTKALMKMSREWPVLWGKMAIFQIQSGNKLRKTRLSKKVPFITVLEFFYRVK